MLSFLKNSVLKLIGLFRMEKTWNIWVFDGVCWKNWKAKFGEDNPWRIQQLAGTLTLQRFKENLGKLRWFLRTNSASRSRDGRAETLLEIHELETLETPRDSMIVGKSRILRWTLQDGKC